MAPPSLKSDDDLRSSTRAAMFTSGAIIAYQVAGKATRDAFFLGTHEVTSLPLAVLGSAAVSVLLVFLAAGFMHRWGPARLVPIIFLSSAALLLVEWLIAQRSPRFAATAVYLHFNALGALLISGFWSVVSERFDPHTAKRQVGRIGAAGTLGGLVGGIIAERVGAAMSVTAMLPVLAGIHLICAGAIRGLAGSRASVGSTAEHPSVPPMPEFRGSGVNTIAQRPYLRSLVALVLLIAVTEGLVDYVFKARASGFAGADAGLIRLFAGFYTGVQLVTFLVQITLTRRALETLGLARTVAALPAAVSAGATAMIIAPGLFSAVMARGVEAILHNSLFRSAYELLFTPLPREEKRATKTLVDVGCARLGDALGAGLVQLALILAPVAALPALSISAVVTGLIAMLLALHLHQAYLRALEKSLLARAIQLELPDIADSTTRTTFLSTIPGSDLLSVAAKAPSPTPHLEAAAARSPRGPVLDADARLIIDLRSGEATRVGQALAGSLPKQAIGHVIPLLAWDEVAPAAVRALRAAAPRAVGQLVDALLDPEEDFGVRRRIPAVLAHSDSPRAVEGLLLALEDSRFEVRYRAGRALLRSLDRTARLPEDRVFAAVLREANVGEGVWESQRLLDRSDEEDASPFADEALRDRANRSLEHVFTLLSLVFPRQPLTVAFRGLYTDDPLLRGTALEYLESLLPPAVREKLWPFLGDLRGKDRPSRPRAEVLADLMLSHQSIALNLEKLRIKQNEQPAKG